MLYIRGNCCMEAVVRGGRIASGTGVAGVVQEGQSRKTEGAYPDVQHNLRIEEERIDHVAEWLEVALGIKLTAYAVGCSASEITRWAHGDDEAEPTTEKRLRNPYPVALFKVVNDGGGSPQEGL